jgi:hypothetical protein
MAKVFGGSVAPQSVWTPAGGGQDSAFIAMECSHACGDGRCLCGKRDLRGAKRPWSGH